MNLPGVIFDMDGLLLDTERVCLDCFVETRRKFKLDDAPEIFLSTVGLRGNESDSIIRNSLQETVNFQDFSDAWDQRIDEVLNTRVPVKTGAKELLHILEIKGHPLAVATSTRSAEARKHLEAADLLQHFKTVVGGDQVENGKPDPEVYHKAAEQIGRQAQNCFAFEDSATGVRAAFASRARTIQIPDLIAPPSDLKALGHIIAPSLLVGALAAGLIDRSDF